MTVYNNLVALALGFIYQLRSEQILLIERDPNIYFLVKSCQSGNLLLPQHRLCHGKLLLARKPDQAGGEHRLNHLHRHQVAS